MEESLSGGVKILVRLESLTIFFVAIALYAKFGGSWWFFLCLFLLPDISFLGYLAGSHIGALTYNAAHSYIGPAILLSVAIFFSFSTLIAMGLIWIAHIGMDRALGYGLKYSQGFKYTHLGLIGRTLREK